MRAYARRRQGIDYESVVNLALADAFRGLPTFRARDRRAFRAYLFRILRRRIADEYQREVRQPRVVLSYDQVASWNYEEETAFDDRVVDADETAKLLSQLTEQQREVVELRVLTGFSVRETADHTGRSLTAVKAMQRRALLSLRAIVAASAIILIGFIGMRIVGSLSDEPMVVSNDPASTGNGDRHRESSTDEESSLNLLPDSSPVVDREPENDDFVNSDEANLSTEAEKQVDGQTGDKKPSSVSQRAVAQETIVMEHLTGRKAKLGAATNGPAAFPNAVGWSANSTTGGRGGKVITVDSLANTVDPNDGVTTFREAMTSEDGPRIIVFSVAGTIDYRTGRHVPASKLILDASDSDVTVACQSAPAPGITLAGDGIHFGAQNVIVRHCRIHNTMPASESSAQLSSCLKATAGLPKSAPKNIVFDHVSCMWAASSSIVFGVPSIANPAGDNVANVALSNSVVANGSPFPFSQKANGRTSTVPAGARCVSTNDGRIVERCSLVANLFVNMEDDSATLSGIEGGEMVNNIAYNFTNTGLTAKARTTVKNNIDATVAGNLVKPGPDSKASTKARYRPIDLSGNTTANSKVDVTGNYVGEGGQRPKLIEDPLFDLGTTPSTARSADGRDILSMASRSSDHLRCIGASRPQRDVNDQTVIDQFLNGTGSAQERNIAADLSRSESHRWSDSDGDGMPDSWERKVGIDDPSGRDLSGTYTNVEVFLNGLAQCPALDVQLKSTSIFPAGTTHVSIAYDSTWLTWPEGQTIEVCVSGSCQDYTDPENDQIFVATELEAGDHHVTLALKDAKGTKLPVSDEVTFRIR